jgi:hypothetical protein
VQVAAVELTAAALVAAAAADMPRGLSRTFRRCLTAKRLLVVRVVQARQAQRVRVLLVGPRLSAGLLSLVVGVVALLATAD